MKRKRIFLKKIIHALCVITLINCLLGENIFRAEASNTTESDRSRQVHDLIQTMKEEYPSFEFEKAGTSLAHLTEELNDSDLNLIIQGYLEILQGDYKNYGNYKITLGFYFMAHDRFRYILRYHQQHIIPMLQYYLVNSEVELANGAAFLLGVFDDGASLPYLKRSKAKFQNDQVFNIFVDAAISILSPSKQIGPAQYSELTLNQRVEIFLVHDITFQVLNLSESAHSLLNDDQGTDTEAFDLSISLVKDFYSLDDSALLNIMEEGVDKNWKEYTVPLRPAITMLAQRRLTDETEIPIGTICNLINVKIEEPKLSIEQQKEVYRNFLTLAVILKYLDFDIGGTPNDIATQIVLEYYDISEGYFDSIVLKGYAEWMDEYHVEDIFISRLIKKCNSERRLPTIPEVNNIETLSSLTPTPLSIKERREIYWVYAVAHMALDASQNVNQEENRYYPSEIVEIEYGIDMDKLSEIIDEGNEKGWGELLPLFEITLLIMNCDGEERLPTVEEIKETLSLE